MSLGNSIRSGSAWLMASNAGGQVLGFVFGVVLARLLLPADFGLLVTMQIFTGVAGLVAGGGMSQALVRAKEADLKDFRVVFTLQLGICILIYLFFFTIAPWFADWFHEPIYSELLRVTALNFLLRPFAGMPRTMLRREMNFRPIAIVQLASIFVTSSIAIAMALLGYGVWSLAISGLAGSVFAILVLSRYTGWKIYGFAFDREAARVHGSFGMKVSFEGIISHLRSQTSNFIVSRFLGASMVGLFNKADSLGKLPHSIISASVFEPLLRAMAKEQDNLDLSRYLYFRAISLITLYTLPIYLGLAWLAHPFIQFVYGDNWVPAADPLQILALGGIFYCIGHPSGAVFAAQNRLGTDIRIQLEVWVVMAIFGLVGLQWGLKGLAWAMLGVEGYSMVRSTHRASVLIGGSLRDLLVAVAPGLGLNALMLAVMGAAHLAGLGVLQQTRPVVYLVVMSAGGGLTYGLAFLYLPIPSLESEALRWKSKLRLA